MIFNKKFIAVIVCVTTLMRAESLLEKLESYCAAHEEFPEMDSQYTTDPDYTRFFNTLKPSLLSKVRTKLTKQYNFLSAEHFSELLHKTAHARIQAGLHVKTVLNITTANDAQFFIWGPLHGTLHPLIRSLRWLCADGVIDEELVIKKTDHFLVFNGDTINRSAYSMQVLTVILLLMDKNPNLVLYLKGNHERYSYWRNFNFKKQLQILARHLSNDPIPFANTIDQFFSSLPEIIYLNKTTAPDHTILIYFGGIDTLDDRLIDKSYLQNINNDTIYYTPIARKDAKPIDFSIAGVICREDWLRDLRAIDGLGLLDQTFGITNWSILSVPSPANRAYYKFDYDVFVKLSVLSPIEKSTLTLYQHDIKASNKNFDLKKKVNIVTGRPMNSEKPYAEGDNLILSSTMSLIQGIPVVGKRLKQGLDTVINDYNQKGGLKGRHIQLDVRNDNYIPSQTRDIVHDLVDQGREIFFASLGDPTLAMYTDLIAEKKIAMLFPIAGSPQFRTSNLKGIAHMCASYPDGVRGMIDYIVKTYDRNRFAFFYQNDDYGLRPLEAAKDQLKKNDIDTSIDLPYARGNVVFDNQSKKIKEAQIDALAFFSTSNATAEFIRQLELESIMDKRLMGTFLLGDASFKSFMQRRGLQIMLGSRVPNPALSPLPIIKEYRETMDKYKYPYDIFSLEGFLAAKFLIRILESIEGDINKDSILAKIESFKDYDFGGFIFNFNPNTRSLAPHIWLQTGDENEWLKTDVYIK